MINYFKYYDKLYSDGAVVRFVNDSTGKTKTCKYHNNKYFYNVLIKNVFIKNINSYIEKYPNENKVDKIILDFDGDDKVKVYDEVMSCCKYLKDNDISYFVEDSTNKGYHLFILLFNKFNFNLSNNFSVNNKLFKCFINNLLNNKEYKYIDKVNMGLRTNIRLFGSVHPKTNKRVDKVTWFCGNYNKFVIDCYNKACDMVEEIKYNGRWRKIVNYDNSYVDLRELPWDNIKHTDNNSLWCSCHWHKDNNPSLRVYEKSAYCMKCGRISFDKIKDYFNL